MPLMPEQLFIGKQRGIAQALLSAIASMGAFAYLLGFLVPSLANVYITMEMPMPAATRFFYSLCRFPLPLIPVLLLIGLGTYAAVRATQARSTARMLVLVLIMVIMLGLVGLAIWLPMQNIRSMIQQLD